MTITACTVFNLNCLFECLECREAIYTVYNSTTNMFDFTLSSIMLTCCYCFSLLLVLEVYNHDITFRSTFILAVISIHKDFYMSSLGLV